MNVQIYVRKFCGKESERVRDGPYRKDYLTVTGIARGLLAEKEGARIPTVEQYTKNLGCSRGLVQNALAQLEATGAVVLEKRGKSGTFLAQKCDERLFAGAGLAFFTGSMPTPLNIHLAGLATGVCQAMGRCGIPFTFAFVQGAQNRVDALLRQIYDFVVVTRAAAGQHVAQHPELQVAFPLAGCEYSPPYMLYIARPGVGGLQPGMKVAVDASSTDQWNLTQLVCKDKEVSLVQLPYISTSVAFLAGDVDAVVQRSDIMQNAFSAQAMGTPVVPRIAQSDVSCIEIPQEAAQGMQQPVVLVHSGNVGIAGILEQYLAGGVVAHIQNRVVQYQMPPQFY